MSGAADTYGVRADDRARAEAERRRQEARESPQLNPAFPYRMEPFDAGYYSVPVEGETERQS